MQPVTRPGISVSGILTNANRVVSVASTATVKESLLLDAVTAGVLSIAKTGSTARTATFPDADITVARIDAAQTFTGQSTFTDGILTTHCDAATSAGVHVGNVSHQDVVIFGAGGGQGAAFADGITCSSITATSASGITTLQAATQDAVRLLGRAGGTGSYIASITPTTLSASRTYTLPDASIVVAGSASALTSGRVPYATTGGLLTDITTLTFSGNTLSVGDNATLGGFSINGPAGSQRYLAIRTAGSLRWTYGAGTAAEGGSDAGSPLEILARNDAGGAIDTPVSIVRAAGGTITLARPVSITNTTASTSTTTGALVVSGGVGVGGDVWASVHRSSSTGVVFGATGATTSGRWLTCGNTGTQVTIGNEASVGGANFLGSTAYDSVFYSTTRAYIYGSTGVQLNANGNTITLTGPVSCSSTTDATTTAAAGLILSGGLGIAKSVVQTASSAGATYWGPVATDGTVRMYGNGSGQLIIEARVSGSYTEIGRIG